jgi:hypothetical protein
MGSVPASRTAAAGNPAQVVPNVCKVDAEHEAQCREAIVQARLQAQAQDDDREVSAHVVTAAVAAAHVVCAAAGCSCIRCGHKLAVTVHTVAR